jgi:hypothetical protein
MHGGAHGSGAPSGPRNGNYKHGRYTEEVAAIAVSSMLKCVSDAINPL